jgi:hypothetical protein
MEIVFNWRKKGIFHETEINKMNRYGKRILFYFGIAVILSGIATILSSPVFFEKRVFDENKIDVTVTETAEPTTENSFFKPTTDEKMHTTLTAATTTETTVTTLAVKEESLPFCLEEPTSTVY